MYNRIHSVQNGTNTNPDELRKLEQNIAGYCSILARDGRALIDIIHEKVKAISEKNGTSCDQILLRLLKFPETNVVREKSHLFLREQLVKKSLTKTSKEEAIIIDSLRDRITDLNEYHNRVNEFDSAAIILPFYQEFHTFLRSEGLEEYAEVAEHLVDYLKLYQSLTKKCEGTLNLAFKKEVDIDLIVENFIDAFEKHKSIGFAYGWYRHSTSVQVSFENGDLVFRQYNAGDKSPDHPTPRDPHSSIGSKAKVRPVLEYKFPDFDMERDKQHLKSLLEILVQTEFDSRSKATEHQYFIYETHRMLQLNFRPIPLSESQLGEFKTLPQWTGSCIINSLKLHLKGVMVLKLGETKGADMHAKFEDFLIQNQEALKLRASQRYANFTFYERRFLDSSRTIQKEDLDRLLEQPMDLIKPSIKLILDQEGLVGARTIVSDLLSILDQESVNSEKTQKIHHLIHEIVKTKQNDTQPYIEFLFRDPSIRKNLIKHQISLPDCVIKHANDNTIPELLSVYILDTIEQIKAAPDINTAWYTNQIDTIFLWKDHGYYPTVELLLINEAFQKKLMQDDIMLPLDAVESIQDHPDTYTFDLMSYAQLCAKEAKSNQKLSYRRIEIKVLYGLNEERFQYLVDGNYAALALELYNTLQIATDSEKTHSDDSIWRHVKQRIDLYSNLLTKKGSPLIDVIKNEIDALDKINGTHFCEILEHNVYVREDSITSRDSELYRDDQAWQKRLSRRSYSNESVWRALNGNISDTTSLETTLDSKEIMGSLQSIYSFFKEHLSQQKKPHTLRALSAISRYLSSYQMSSSNTLDRFDGIREGLFSPAARVGFSYGWNGCRTSIQLVHENFSTLTLRQFNTGERSDRYPSLKTARDSISNEAKVRTVIEYTHHNFRRSHIVLKKLLKALDEAAHNQTHLTLSTEKMKALGFELNSLDESKLGNFIAMQDWYNDGLITSIMQDLRSIMIYTLGIEAGEALQKEFEKYLFLNKPVGNVRPLIPSKHPQLIVD